MPDRNQQSQRPNSDYNLNAKEPAEIDKAPIQDIEKVELESKEKNKLDEDLSKEPDRPIER